MSVNHQKPQISITSPGRTTSNSGGGVPNMRKNSSSSVVNSPSGRTSGALNVSLLRLKLLDGLRLGDGTKVDQILNELNASELQNIRNTELIQLRETVLHYAVQVAPLSCLQHLINHPTYKLDINSQDPEGNTPLHLAVLCSRIDIVKYLLSLPEINDTILNLNLKQPVEVCKDLNIAQLMQFERAKFLEKSANQLRVYFTKRDFQNLSKLLLSPRSAELLDINGTDPETGDTVLTEFIKKNDFEMCDWILKHGGDPFKRDKKGRLPVDLCSSKNEKLRKLIKHASKEQNILDPVINNQGLKGPPTYKGYLRKWTNIASGYKLRYFVLDTRGILSYYTNQEDTNNACRGSINLSYSTLHLDSSEKLKFEILGKNNVRWHLKANHPIETSRWVWTLQNAISIAKDNLKKKNLSSMNAEENRAFKNKASFEKNQSASSSSLNPPKNRHQRVPSNISTISATSVGDNDSSFNPPSRVSTSGSRKFQLSQISENKSLNIDNTSNDSRIPSSTSNDYQGVNGNVSDFDNDSYREDFDEDDDDYSSHELLDDESNDYMREIKSEGNINQQTLVMKRSIDVELASLIEFFKNAAQQHQNGVSQQSDDIFSVSIQILNTITDLFSKYNTLLSARDQVQQKKLERQLEVNHLWENSIRQLENEMSNRESKLVEFEDKKKQLVKILKKHNDDTPFQDNRVANETKDIEDLLKGEDSDDEFFDADEFDEFDDDEGPQVQNEIVAHNVIQPREESSEINKVHTFALTAATLGAANNLASKANKDETVRSHPANSTFQEDNDLSEKMNDLKMDEKKTVNQDLDYPPPPSTAPPLPPSTAPKLTSVPVPLSSSISASASSSRKEADTPMRDDLPPIYTSGEGADISDYTKEKSGVEVARPILKNKLQQSRQEVLEKEGSFLGYESPIRKRLAMSEDDRPKVGLWGILKSMIGKDMTRMTLPVSFNECTSLLQRLAEDIEYSDLLSHAVTIDDSTLRLAYVAAFAASEYASTINRIAKPFNPLLGETFEYVRPDKDYRLLVEQVSHHPPVSAARAESAKWDYYGENAVDSQFRGRSFDFKHLGKMFCNLRPDNGVVNLKGEKIQQETYSWKKVNTAVVGIIVGNPVVDNYGKMEVTNHTTGDKIIVDMKQRGWRASSAYELKGTVVDAKGKEHWMIGGRWDSKMFAKRIVGNSPEGRRNSLVNTTDASSQDTYSGSKFLIWQVNPRPKIPFNLTEFACSLNAINDNLVKYLAPTDTRLRPDQRAMEDGKYDLAADEKHRLEEKQRAARKEREVKGQTYKPNWFVKKKHPVTGDAYWDYTGEYWKFRRDQKLSNCGDIF